MCLKYLFKRAGGSISKTPSWSCIPWTLGSTPLPKGTYHSKPTGDVIHQPVNRLKEGIKGSVTVSEGVVQERAQAQTSV